MIVLGLIGMPNFMSQPYFIINRHILENRLNEPDAFDVQMLFKPKDKLEIVLNSKAKKKFESHTYNFIFKRGKWVAVDEDPFGLINEYVKYASGKIKSALKRESSFSSEDLKYMRLGIIRSKK